MRVGLLPARTQIADTPGDTLFGRTPPSPSLPRGILPRPFHTTTRTRAGALRVSPTRRQFPYFLRSNSRERLAITGRVLIKQLRPGQLLPSFQGWEPQAGGAHRRTATGDTEPANPTPTPATGISARCARSTPTSDGAGTHIPEEARFLGSQRASEHPLWRSLDRHTVLLHTGRYAIAGW